MRAAVLGSPVAHSLSPALHRAAYAHLGLRWRYDAIECEERDLAGFVASLGPEWAGLSLTMPLKSAALALADEVDAVALATGAANTLLLRGGAWAAANTDVPGMVAALRERDASPSTAPTAALLGAGATARSAVVSLAAAGWSVVDVAARRPEAAADLVGTGAAAGVQVRVGGWDAARGLLAHDLVVSTVPVGAADGLAGAVPAGPGILFDVLYHPWPTPLARAWAAAGGTVVGGLDLLVHQAAGQVRLMTGCEVPAEALVAVMRPAGLAALAARPG
jgi:shikimate dehydrogenase